MQVKSPHHTAIVSQWRLKRILLCASAPPLAVATGAAATGAAVAGAAATGTAAAGAAPHTPPPPGQGLAHAFTSEHERLILHHLLARQVCILFFQATQHVQGCDSYRTSTRDNSPSPSLLFLVGGRVALRALSIRGGA